MSPAIRAARRALPVTLLLLVVLGAPALAVIHPRLLDWQARLGRMLPQEARTRASEVSDGLPATATPQDLRQALEGVAPSLPRPPLELFAGIRLLHRREEILQRFDQRLDLYDRAQGLLHRYCRDAHEALRLAPPGPAGPPAPAPREGLIQPQASEEGIRVLRDLPTLQPEMARARVRLLLLAAEQDLQEVGRRRAEACQARQAFLESTLVWRRHLRQLADGLDPFTGLPYPPREELPGYIPPLIEQIPPPPPLDLPEFREDQTRP